jgi:hypothetical protein
MKKSLVLIASLFLLPAASFACAVCFGGGNANLTRGFFWGVVLLGSLPFILMGTFVSYLVYHTRKRKP